MLTSSQFSHAVLALGALLDTVFALSIMCTRFALLAPLQTALPEGRGCLSFLSVLSKRLAA